MESQTKTQTIKFKKVLVGAEEASGSSGWISKKPLPKMLRCGSAKCVCYNTPNYVSSEEEEEKKDNDVFPILTQVPEDTIEDDNVGLHHNHTCCAYTIKKNVKLQFILHLFFYLSKNIKDPKTQVSNSNIDDEGADTEDSTAAGAAAEKEDPRPNKMLRSTTTTIVNSLAKRASNNIKDVVAVADKEIQELKDEIEEFRRDYDDVISSSDLRTLRTIKKILTVGTVLTPGDYRALRPIRGQFMWGTFNLMQRYGFFAKT